MDRDTYTFGDTTSAADRLALLAAVYSDSTSDLLLRHVPQGLALALDLGAGPGHTTALLHGVLGARRTIGVEASSAFIELARTEYPDLEFVQQDVLDPLPGPADVVLSRFLLTHLSAPAQALRTWSAALAPGGRIVLQEIAKLVSADPVLGRYYELVAEVQMAQGQDFMIGSRFAEIAQAAGLQVQHLAMREVRPDVREMAVLHLLNLRNWRTLPGLGLDEDELDSLDDSLVEIAHGRAQAEPIEQQLAEAVLVLAE